MARRLEVRKNTAHSPKLVTVERQTVQTSSGQTESQEVVLEQVVFRGTTANGKTIEVLVDDDGKLVLAGTISMDGDVTIDTTDLATSSKQDAQHADLAAILAKLADPATQTTLAAVLETLASVLEKLADPATAALQGAGLPAAFGAGGGVKVDGSGTALPVSMAQASSVLLGKVAPCKGDGTIVDPAPDPQDGATFTAGATTGSPIQAAAEGVPSANPIASGKSGTPRVLPTRELVTSNLEDSDYVVVAGVPTVVKRAPIAASNSGNTALVAAVTTPTNKKIRVLAYNLMGDGAVNVKFQSGAGGTDLTGVKYIAAAGGGICAPYNPKGWFETAAGALLNLNLSAAVGVGGELTYVEA